VLVTAHNCADTIGQVISGIQLQQLPEGWNLEIVVGYEVSDDDTLDVLNACARRCRKAQGVDFSVVNSPGPVMLYGRRTGRANLLNALATPGESTVTAFCDCDDVWVAADKLERQIKALASAPSAVSCYTQVSPEQRQFDGHANLFSQGNRNCFSTLLIRTDVLEDCLGTHAELLKTTPVFDWVLAACCAIRGDILWLPDPTVRFGQQDSSSWHGRSESRRYAQSAISARHIALKLRGAGPVNRLRAALLALRLYCLSNSFVRRAVRKALRSS